MKKGAVIIAFVSIFLSMSLIGCNSKSFSYEFIQDQANIATVAISTLDYESKKMETLITLSEENIGVLINDVKSLKCREFMPIDPLLSYGDVVICITYYNGEIEVIGITNIGYIDLDGNWITTRKYFNIKDICAVISKFVDTKVLSEISDYF